MLDNEIKEIISKKLKTLNVDKLISFKIKKFLLFK